MIRTLLATSIFLSYAVIGLMAQDTTTKTTPADAGRMKPQGVLMSAKTEKVYRNIMPKVADKALQDIFADPNTIYYTNTEIPKAHQDFEGAASLHGLHSPAYNISAVRSEPFGNANHEFPWGAPFGTHSAPTSHSFRFLHLPLKEDGARWPVVWWRQEPYYDQRFFNQSGNGYAWIFPVGTTIGEVLYHDDAAGLSHVYEVRTRKRNLMKWSVNVFRPFPTAADLTRTVRDFWPQHADDAGLTAMLKSLNAPLGGVTSTLASNHPDLVPFRQSRLVDELPPIAEAHVRKLLRVTFTSALGADWKVGKNAPHAPTTKSKFHIVPTNYTGGFVEVDSVSCMQCHNTCNKHARDFDFKRDWYGRVRGSDGIFSFHPFDAASVSPNGWPRAITISRDMSAKGIVAAYDRQLHPNTVYRRVAGLQ